MTIEWSKQYAQRTSQVGASAIREIFKRTQQPGIISFAGGLPAPERFPIEAIRVAADRLLTEQGELALQYSATEGYPPLRRFIADQLSRHHVRATEDNVLITSGSQQGLDLIGKVFLNQCDRILVERPTFLGAIQSFNSYGPTYAGIETDDDGLLTDDLAEAIGGGVKFLYVQPNFQNPGGTTLSLERRRTLLEIAGQRDIPIIEDDPYSAYRFEGEPLPPLLAMAANSGSDEGGGDGLSANPVIHLGTFSKTLAPGLRLGWTVADSDVIRRLVVAKQGADLHTSTFMQMLAYEVIKDGFLDEHVPSLRQVYRERRDAMLASLDRHLPEGVRWTSPQGGFFIWATLPEGWDATAMLEEAVDDGVAYVPGVAFFADDGRPPELNTMRLNFSFCPPDVIEEGVRRLGHTIARHKES